jgi:hypothetical protein
MRKDFITFRSITPAQRAQRQLRLSGIEAALQRTPGYLRERGCSYCLRVNHRDLDRALLQLDGAGIPYSKFYREGDVAL